MEDHTLKIFHDPHQLSGTVPFEGKKVVWTNGCFDLFHPGHLHSLKEASNYGDVLIVGLNSDTSVRRLKGTDRPIFSQKFRAEHLALLSIVDAVLLFDDLQPLSALRIIKPNVYAKGADYEVNQLEEAKLVSGLGGQIITLSMLESPSTTDLIDKIRLL